MDNKANSSYTPRPGSKVSAALETMAKGPVLADVLAATMDCPINNVSSLLFQALKNDVVVKVTDSSGSLHFALVEMEMPAGFSLYEPGSSTRLKKLVDPADPFGLVAKRTAPALALAPAPERPIPAPAASQDAAAQFVVALFSTGELMISVGADTVRLCPEHQRLLQKYVARFKD